MVQWSLGRGWGGKGAAAEARGVLREICKRVETGSACFLAGNLNLGDGVKRR